LITLLNFVLVWRSDGPINATPPLGIEGVPPRKTDSDKHGSTLLAKSLELQTQL